MEPEDPSGLCIGSMKGAGFSDVKLKRLFQDCVPGILNIIISEKTNGD